MSEQLNTLEQIRLLRKLAGMGQELERYKRMLRGEQLGTVRFADGAFTDAKIQSLSADKIATGVLNILTEIVVKDYETDIEQILITGEEIRVSKPGIPVRTASIKDMVLLNQEDAHKLSYKGFIASGSYTHGLGRRPIFFCFQVDSTTSPTYFAMTKQARSSTTQIVNIPNPSYLVVFREGI